MEWFNHLLGVETPDGTTLTSAELSFRGPIPWWIAGVLLAACAVGILLLYWRESGGVFILKRLLMAGLRITALVLLVLLLFRPMLHAEFAGQRKQGIVLLLDNTESMTQADKRLSPADLMRVAIAKDLVQPNAKTTGLSLSDIPDKTPREIKRVDLVKAVLTNPRLRLLEGIQAKGPIRPFFFGERSYSAFTESAAGDKDNSLDDLLLRYDGQQKLTALADVINNVLLKNDGDLPAAMVVMTDGQDNASKIPLHEVAAECARLKVPLHIYGVGSSEAGSLQLRDIVLADTIFYDDVVYVPVRYRSQGFKKGTLVVKLELDGKTVAEKEVPLQSGEDLREVMQFTPRKLKKEDTKFDPQAKDDRHSLVATISLKDGKEKDAIARPVRLTDSKVKVLYIENSPRFEYKFLQPVLLRDRRVEADFLLINGDPKVLNSGKPFLPSFPKKREDLLKYHLIILGDVKAETLGKEHMEWLREFVEKFRGGLVCIAGPYHMPSSYLNTPLTEVLPVEFLEVPFRPDPEARPPEFKPFLTEEGQRSDWLSLADSPAENLKTWEGLEGIFWHYPINKLRPGAVSLLAHPKVKMGEVPMPLAATHYYGKGQVLFMGFEETWRWRKNTEDKLFGRFWGQIIYQLGLPPLLGNSSSKVQLSLDRSEALLGRPGKVYARILDKDFQPIKDKQVTAQLVFLDAKPGQESSRTIKLERVEGREGEFYAALQNDKDGRFEVRLSSPEQVVFPFRVSIPPRHELEKSGMAEDELRKAASVSGGRFYQEGELYALPGQIVPRLTDFTIRHQPLLWNPLALCLFLLLVTAEWVLRKFSNLS